MQKNRGYCKNLSLFSAIESAALELFHPDCLSVQCNCPVKLPRFTPVDTKQKKVAKIAGIAIILHS